MLEEYQAQVQTAIDSLQQAREVLEETSITLENNYPEEERTWRMGQAMTALTEANGSIANAMGRLQNIEWPTADRPR